MKKLLSIVCLGLAMLSLTGCGNENVSLNLTNINKELEGLVGDEFYLQGVTTIVECETCKIFKDMEDVYAYDFKKIFGLTDTNIEEYVVRYNKKTKDMYMVLKPAASKEDAIKKEMDAYFKKSKAANMKEVTYEGYLIYVISSDNEKVVEQIKTSRSPIFGAMMEVTKDQVKDTLGIEPSSLDEFLMKSPMMIVNSNTYIIAKPAKGHEKEVEQALDTYMTKLEEQWKTYLPDQYELVRNRKVEKLGNYLIYIVSSDNDKVFQTMKNNQVK